MNATMESTSSSLDGLGYTIGSGILIVFVVVTFVSYTYKRARDESIRSRRHRLRGGTDHVHVNFATTIEENNGLDESTLSSCPQITYSGAKADDSDSGGCSICLADYGNGDLLRLLPDCGHLFHLTCVDPWLLLHSSCPVCHCSPSPPLAPAAGPSN